MKKQAALMNSLLIKCTDVVLDSATVIYEFINDQIRVKMALNINSFLGIPQNSFLNIDIPPTHVVRYSSTRDKLMYSSNRLLIYARIY